MDTHSQCQPNHTQDQGQRIRWVRGGETHTSAPTAAPRGTLLTVPEDREEADGVRGTGVPKGDILNTELIPHLLKEDRPS